MSTDLLKDRKPKILLVDDEARIRLMYEEYLSDEFDVDVASSGKESLQKLVDAYYDLVLLDISMPDLTGLEVLKLIKQDYPNLDVIMFTMDSSVSTVVESMQIGAIDYIEKHKPRELIKLSLQKIVERRGMNHELSYYRSRNNNESALYSSIIGKSQKIQDVISMIKKLKNKDVSILITGENGTGKEKVAELLTHQEGFGKRVQYSINCGAISAHLIESELFGHVKGAFTDARSDRAGLFEMANGNDVFLDEIGELPLELQSKLLRVLQEKEVKRVGSNKTIKVHFRLISSTNRNLKKMIEEGKFREDLYYRLNVVQVHVPPLRERKEDIPLLIRHFLNEAGYQKKEIPDDGISILNEYPWPGNIRQLKNVVINMAIQSGEDFVLGKKYIPSEILFDHASTVHGRKKDGQYILQDIIEDVEKKLIFEALEKTDWVVVKAAELLGTHRNSINNKLKAWNWNRPSVE